MSWTQVFMMILQITAILGGITSFIAIMLGPMFYLGAKIDNIKDQIHQEMVSFRTEIQKEMTDFHGRLCAIEERNKNK